MSTKIYDGMRAIDRNPFRVQRRIKETLEPIFKAKFNFALTTALENSGKPWNEAFPDIVFGVPSARWQQPIPSGRWETGDQLYDMIVELYGTKRRTFTSLDFGYEAVLLPDGRGVTLSPLVLVFSERGGNEYRKALMDAGVIEDYGYWDNSDEPEDVSPVEWRKREKAWKKLDTPRADGLMIAMPSKFEAAYLDDLLRPGVGSTEGSEG